MRLVVLQTLLGRYRSKIEFLLLVLVNIFIFACGNGDHPDGVFCTAVMESVIVVEVGDAVSDAPIAENAIVIITDGDYQETLTVIGYESPDPSSAYLLAGAYEREGVYDIELSLSGYESWSRHQAEVEPGICHVNTVKFTVRLSAI